MALIKCPECGAKIPEGAKRCPRCGTPVVATTNHVNIGKEVDSVKKNNLHYGNNVQNTNSKKFFLGLLGVGMLAIITIIIVIIVANGEKDVSESNTVEENKTTGTCNGHDWVDLGLPSGTKWATCNVGADRSEDYGNYYAWGETSTKNYYDNDKCRYMDYYNYESNLTKYCSNSRFGYIGFSDNLTTLQSSDDAATVNWGSAWRMPTREEYEELKNNCTVTRTTQNGINGYLFTGPNGNSIFLPAAGSRYQSDLGSAGYAGKYWSGSLSTSHPNHAISFYFYSDSEYCFVDIYSRGCGFTVRPVCIQ